MGPGRAESGCSTRRSRVSHSGGCAADDPTAAARRCRHDLSTDRHHIVSPIAVALRTVVAWIVPVVNSPAPARKFAVPPRSMGAGVPAGETALDCRWLHAQQRPLVVAQCLRWATTLNGEQLGWVLFERSERRLRQGRGKRGSAPFDEALCRLPELAQARHLAVGSRVLGLLVHPPRLELAGGICRRLDPGRGRRGRERRA